VLRPATALEAVVVVVAVVAVAHGRRTRTSAREFIRGDANRPVG
jgi:hypothetical protein